MKKLAWFIALTILTVGLIATPVMAKTRWNANLAWPPKNHHCQAMVEYSKMVNEATKGDLDIVVNMGGALGYKGPELLKVVRDGLLPMSDMVISSVAGDAKIFQIVTLPFLCRDLKDAKLLTDIARPYFEKTAKKWKQKILYIAPWPPTGLWSKEKVQTVEDMKGRKVRTYDKNGALLVKSLGGTPYALPFSEVYSSLATGLIDSVITSTSTAVDGKFWEVLKYFQRFNITIATDMVNVNLRAFNKLNKKTQKILVDKGREMEKTIWARVADLDKEKEAECNKKGIESTKVSPEMLKALRKASQGIHKDWLKSATPDAVKIYKEFKAKTGD